MLLIDGIFIDYKALMEKHKPNVDGGRTRNSTHESGFIFTEKFDENIFNQILKEKIFITERNFKIGLSNFAPAPLLTIFGLLEDRTINLNWMLGRETVNLISKFERWKDDNNLTMISFKDSRKISFSNPPFNFLQMQNNFTVYREIIKGD